MENKRKVSAKPLNAMDPAIGMRVGTIVGGLSGALLAFMTVAQIWMVFLGGFFGGAIGYLSAKRTRLSDSPRPMSW